MDTKFTKGKWQISRLYNTLLEINVNGLNICEVDCCGNFNKDTSLVSPTEEERANANLIITAPDMYKMLENVLKDSQSKWLFDADYVRLKDIIKLLTKARGEL
jgi:hypothetical protein